MLRLLPLLLTLCLTSLLLYFIPLSENVSKFLGAPSGRQTPPAHPEGSLGHPLPQGIPSGPQPGQGQTGHLRCSPSHRGPCPKAHALAVTPFPLWSGEKEEGQDSWPRPKHCVTLGSLLNFSGLIPLICKMDRG